MGKSLTFALAIHRGAWNIPDGAVDAHRRGVLKPLTEGFDALRRGASAFDAGRGGGVLVDRNGRAGASFNTPPMARGFADSRGLAVLVERPERLR